MGISESDNCCHNSISTFDSSQQQTYNNKINNLFPMNPSEENISDTDNHSLNSETTEITKEFFENYPILEIPWDDPSLYVEDDENMNENFVPVSIQSYPVMNKQPVNDRWSCLKSEPSKKLTKVTKKKSQNCKNRNALKSQSSEDRFISECSDCFTVPEYDVDETSPAAVYQRLEENYQRQNYIHEKILQLQEEAYQLEYEAHFLQTILYPQQY